MRKSRSLNSSEEQLVKLYEHEAESRRSHSPRPGLKRHRSLAELARGHKLHQGRSCVEENNVHKFYSTPHPDNYDTYEHYDGPDYIDPANKDDPSLEFTKRSHHHGTAHDKDFRAVKYMMPESLRAAAARRNVPENPNFLYRIGSQVFMNAGRDASMSSHGHEIHDEDAGRHGDANRVLHVGQSFTFENESDSDSDQGSDVQFPIKESRSAKLLEFIITDILGFDATPESTTAKRALREHKAGVYDPGLALGIIAGFT